MRRSPVRTRMPDVRHLLGLFALVAATSCDGGPTSPHAVDEGLLPQAAQETDGPAVVISQVYGGGGNSGAPVTHDFVELFNRSLEPVSVAGWSVQYASSTGNSWGVTPLTNVTIPAGGYYLIRMAGGTTGTPLPEPDAVGTTTMSATAGKVILVNVAATLTGTACPTDASVQDRVAYGSSNANADGCTAAWGFTGALSNTTAALRNGDGCAYTGSATSDFTRGAPVARSSATTPVPCNTTPVDPDSVAITPLTAALEVGSTQMFTATAFAAQVPTATTLRYASSDPLIARIDSITGVATAVAPGSATITVRTANGITATATVTVTAPPDDAPQIVISQLYGAGGNANAVFTHDYVELFNRGSEPVSIAGWSIQYGSSSGTTWQVNTITSGTIPAGGYFLVRLASGTNGDPLPLTADAFGGINMAGGAGKVIVARTGTALTGACPTGSSVIDRVAYGTTNCATEWGAAPALSSVLAGFRRALGCADTRNGATDFTALTPAPRNSESLRAPCAGPATLAIAPATATVEAGGTHAFGVTARDGAGAPVFTVVSWESSNPAVAHIDPATGIATGLSAGSATITARAPNGVTATAELTVTPAQPGRAIVITEFLSDPAGADTQGEWFELHNRGGEAVDLSGWTIQSNSSTGSEVHVINTSVVIPAGGFAVFGNHSSEFVTYSYAGDIILNNSNTDWLVIRAPAGETIDSVAYSTRAADGSIVAPQFSPAPAQARVLLNEALDNSVAAGGNWQNAATPFGDGSNRGTPGYGAYGTAGPVTRIIITPSQATALIGVSATFSATPLDAVGRISTQSVTWSSANSAIATVDPMTGVATGVTEGATQIRANVGSASGSGTFTIVHPDSPASVSVNINDPSWLPVGYMKRLFVTVQTYAGNTIAPDVTWLVSDATRGSVVVMDGRAYVSVTGEGPLQVTATTTNGVSGSASLTVLPADAPTPADYENHVEFGTPTDADMSDDITVVKRGFVASYNALRGGPNWVSWNLNATHFGAAPRCDCFSPDLSLPSGVDRVFDVDYINSGYDRGHMVQSESRTSTEQENAATFLLTNILPQAAANNQGSWLRFENHLNDLARLQNRDVFVIAGGEYGADAPTLNNAGKVVIPHFTWKIAVIMPRGAGVDDVVNTSGTQVIAVRMPNLTTTASNGAWETFVTTVDAIEEATGYDFLTSLPDWIERIVEANDRYPTASAPATLAGVEGTAFGFSGTATDPDAGDVLSYRWVFGDGTTAESADATHTYADNGSYDALFIATDRFGAADTVEVAVTVGNVAPSLASLAARSLLLGEQYTASAPFTDPGADTWSAVVDYGDGSTPATSALLTRTVALAHDYAAAGSYTVTITVTDDDGESTTTSMTVTVLAAAQGIARLLLDIDALVTNARLTRGNATALKAPLQAAQKLLERGDEESAEAAAIQIDAFLNQLPAFVAGDRISADDAAALSAYALRIRASIR
jgi:DNA/RNA endonuclease G (NUC1)/uncharacterized protein YjdB